MPSLRSLPSPPPPLLPLPGFPSCYPCHFCGPTFAAAAVAAISAVPAIAASTFAAILRPCHHRSCYHHRHCHCCYCLFLPTLPRPLLPPPPPLFLLFPTNIKSGGDRTHTFSTLLMASNNQPENRSKPSQLGKGKRSMRRTTKNYDNQLVSLSDQKM